MGAGDEGLAHGDRGLLLLPSPPSPCLSVLLASSAGDMGPVVPAWQVRHWGTWGWAQGLFLGGSCLFEYMSRSGFNYSNWLLEGRAGACPCSKGEREHVEESLSFVPGPEACPCVPSGTWPMPFAHTHTWCTPVSNPT